MSLNIDYKDLLYNELDEHTNEINDLVKNDVIRSYLYLLNNIKKIIYQNIFLNEIEWFFYIKKLVFLKKVIKLSNLKNKYKKIFLKKIDEYLLHIKSPIYE